MSGIPIGQLLVEQGVMTARQVQHILRVQRACNRPFGDLAERLYGITPKAIEDAWVEQYIRTAGLTDLEALEFDKECLRVLHRRQAWQFHLLPVNRESDRLNLATDASNLARAVNFSTRRIDDEVFFLVAEREQLREFLMRHYPVPEYFAQYAAQMRK